MVQIRVPGRGLFTCSGNTVEEAILCLRETLQSETWHGNVLLSNGARRLGPKDCLNPLSGDLVLTNYSRLSSGPPIHIPAIERRGITIQQLVALRRFVKNHLPSWCETYGDNYGQPIEFEHFNFHDAKDWVINPATSPCLGPACSYSYADGGYSYVELVTASAQTKVTKRLWFVTHSWEGPIYLFIECLQRHAILRGLPDTSAYWVAAYAINPHCENPQESGFYRSLKHSVGILSVVDRHDGITAIRCIFEALEVDERKRKSFLVDVAATDQSAVAHLIIDGLAAEEQKMIPLLGLLTKVQREAQFPRDMLMKCLGLDKDAAHDAIRARDKILILNSIAFPGARKRDLRSQALALESLDHYNAVNRRMAAVFSLSNQFSSLARGYDTSRLLQGLQDGEPGPWLVESVMQRLEQELWTKEDYELPEFILEFRHCLQRLAVQDIDRKIGELRASQSEKAGVSMRYLLSQELLTWPMGISTFGTVNYRKK